MQAGVMDIFVCKKCGHCCEGSGGIVLSFKDIERLCKFLKIPEETFFSDFTDKQNRKRVLKSSNSNYCVFFKKGIGCSVHDAKPDICRAWPFFKGNLTDSVSLKMARDYCPGISPDCTFDEFVETGIKYIRDNGLTAENESGAEALKLSFLMKG